MKSPKLEEDHLEQSKDAYALFKEAKELEQQILNSLGSSVESMLED